MQQVVVAAVVTVNSSEVNKFAPLGLVLEEGRIVCGPPLVPPPSVGLYARRNLDGWSDKRTDLPLEHREVSTWAPSWNSGSFHLVSRDVLAYPLEHHRARMVTISATVLEHLVDGALVRFRVDQPLDRSAPSFVDDLRFNLRLLREAVGQTGIFDADLSDADFARIQHIDWELLPPGSGERVIGRFAAGSVISSERLQVAAERLRVLDSLGHDGYLVGLGRFARYFGAKFGDRIVALENLEYGNALYVFTENWEELTQLSRTELIKRRDPAVQRFPHVSGWRNALRKLIINERACRVG